MFVPRNRTANASARCWASEGSRTRHGQRVAIAALVGGVGVRSVAVYRMDSLARLLRHLPR